MIDFIFLAAGAKSIHRGVKEVGKFIRKGEKGYFILVFLSIDWF